MKAFFSSLLLCWQYLDSGPCFVHEDDQRKLPPPSRSDLKPQYVHHLAPKPPPEISHSVPKRKGSPVSCSSNQLFLLLKQELWKGFFSKKDCKQHLSLCIYIPVYTRCKKTKIIITLIIQIDNWSDIQNKQLKTYIHTYKNTLIIALIDSTYSNVSYNSDFCQSQRCIYKIV